MANRLHGRGVVSAVLATLLGLTACERGPAVQEEVVRKSGIPRPVANALDRDTAERRKARISGLEYELFIDIAAGPDEFLGEALLRFDLTDADSDLTVDFAGGSIVSVTVNDAVIDPDYNGNFLTIPADALAVGQTEIRVSYTHPYANDGNGLHRFVDPEDGEAYLYTYLWPYYANQLFPAFDQPNLKASFNLQVRAPEGWTVVSTAPGEPAPAVDGAALWRFEPTPDISTYFFSLHAGPYRIWEADADGVPLRLLARQTLAPYVPVDEWFELTRRGMAFFTDYFEIPYPFAKYDQLIAPEATIGGMENAAAVTYGEYFVQRREGDLGQRENRADVILHELAHMWFGDLVTHDWWNGMWLNESFAELMAAESLAAVTEFTDVRHGFLIRNKQRAYYSDSRVTTHPIEMPIASTDEFHLVWDAITYQKGASVQKQLQHFVGPENFRRGVTNYLKAHSWGNTTLADFIAFQEQSAGMSLADWSDEWLLAPGFNTLASEVECDGDVLRSLAVVQSASESDSPLRTHSVDVALYEDNGAGAIVAAKVIPLIVEGARTPVVFPESQRCPDIVNPNHNDWTFAQIELSESDVALLTDRLADIEDPFSRSIFLAALYDRAMAGVMPLAAYVDIALGLAQREENRRVVQQITSTIVGATDLMRRLRPETDGALARLLPEIERTSLRQAQTAALPDLKHLWFDAFLGTASSESGIDTVRALLDGNAEIDDIDISPEIRWRLLRVLSSAGADDAQARLDAEQSRDRSDFARKQWLSARAAVPDSAAKTAALEEIQAPESTTGLAEQRAVMGALFPAGQTDLQVPLLDDILAAMPELSRVRSSYFLSSYADMLLTPMCQPESVARMRAALAEFGDQLDPTTLRFLRESEQADRECLALRSRQ
jgi:aminopeptidase N